VIVPPASRRETAGFSFVELLASVAILSMLATIAMPLAETTLRRQKEHDLRQALQQIRSGLDAYKQASDNGRIALAQGDSGYPPTLTDLSAGVADVTQPGVVIYFLRSVPRDPFYPDATTPAVNTWGLRSYQSPPDNPAPGSDVFDIYSQSSLTGLNGVAYGQW
jgi:general secretion pathway protein G